MLHYILQIIAFQLLFIVVYDLFLKKETFFTWNRLYLLITPVLSLILPLVKIPALTQSIPDGYKIELPEILIGNLEQESVLDGGVLQEVVVTGTSALDIYALLLNVWYTGIVISLFLFGYKLYKIWKLKRLGSKRIIDGTHVVSIPNSTTAFSFFNTLFLGADLQEQQQASILMHEIVHMKERHSLDMLFFEIQRIVFWFNPLVYVYQNNMMLLQEYVADAKVVDQTDKKGYYQSLLEQVFKTENISFTNTFFNHSLIKKRIIMLQKSKSNQLARLKYVLLIPVVCSMLFYVACSEDNSTLITEIERSENRVNLLVQYGNFGTNEALVVGVKDIDLLTKKEETFIELAKFEEGFKDLKRTTEAGDGENAFGDMGELFFVNYTKRLKAVADSNGVKILGLDSKKVNEESQSEKAFYEKESKYIDFDDAHAVPYAVIEKVPIFPGCDGDNATLKECMSGKISKYVNRNFDTSIGSDLGLTGVNRIFVSFIIDTNGEVVNVRSRAPHLQLETEAKRVIEGIPIMIPGEQNGQAVDVLYSLPITFKIAD